MKTRRKWIVGSGVLAALAGMIIALSFGLIGSSLVRLGIRQLSSGEACGKIIRNLGLITRDTNKPFYWVFVVINFSV